MLVTNGVTSYSRQGRIYDILSAGANSAYLTGVSRIQTGFLVGRFVFTPTQKVASKTFKEINHIDAAFCFKLS